MKLFTVVYSHKYGVDAWNLTARDAAEKFLEEVKSNNEFDENNEVIEIIENELIVELLNTDQSLNS